MWTEDSFKHVDPALLQSFVEAICLRMGADDDVADEVANHLVSADLSGHRSHGVLRLIQHSAELDRGDLAPKRRPEVVSQRNATLLLDGGRGFGHFSTRIACEYGLEIAAREGAAAVLVRRSGHIGRLGHYCELISQQGLVCLLTVGAAGPDIGVMMLPGTTQRFLAANPWAIGIPGDDHPVVVDISTTMIAEGKVTWAASSGQPVPPDCIVDAEGRPSRDPDAYFGGGAILPLGGLIASHKGFGLGLAAALLGGLAMINDSDPTLAGSQRPPRSTRRPELAGVCLIVIDPNAFGGRRPYRSAVTRLVREMRGAGEARTTVTVPGAFEERNRTAHRGGLALPSTTVTQLSDLADRFGISNPFDAA
ncbi:Ldh family oxidoreductase [Nocardia sp. NPDC051570]|uniref:Ldh family oxidoreductase n=1 Tax=Nocardia sp. NPDC051570 TaxID=3364324 RepID=UPI0037A5F51E